MKLTCCSEVFPAGWGVLVGALTLVSLTASGVDARFDGDRVATSQKIQATGRQ